MMYSEWHKYIFSFRKIESFKCELGNDHHSGKKHYLSNRLYDLVSCSDCISRNKSFLEKRDFKKVGEI